MMGRATTWETGHLSLPLDGYASQHGEVFARFLNTGEAPMNLTLSALTGHSGAGDNHLNLAVWDTATQQLTSGCSSKGDQTFIHGYSVAKSPPAAGGPLCPRVALPVGGSTEWIEVGSLLDSYSRSTPNVFCPPPPASKAGPGVFRPRHMEL